MARKKRGSAAAARAAKARASRESSQKQKQESKEPVPETDENMDTTTVSEVDDTTTTQTEEEFTEEAETETVPPTTDAPSTSPDNPPENKNENVESKDEASLPDVAAVVTPDNKDTTTTEATTVISITENNPQDVEVNTEKDYYLDTLLTDQSYLIDVSLGYSPQENLKQPLKGFTTEDELQLFPVIESMSAKLYTIVQKMIDCQRRDVKAVLKSKKGIIKIPNMLIRSYLCHVNFMEPPSETDKAVPSKRAPHPFLLTEDENMFPDDKLKLLRAVLDAGWKREVVMRSPGSTGRKTGDVYYYAPDGTKFRSSKQVEKHLAEQGDSPFTIENFTFAKVRISTNPDQEIVRKAYDGKSPPRPPPKPVSSKVKATTASKGESSRVGPKASSSTSKESVDADSRSVDEPVKGVSSRRSIQPPKRYSGDAVLLLSKRSKVQDDKHRNANANKGMMQMGMLPPKYPKGMEDSSSKLPEGMELAELGYIDNEDSSGSKSVAMKEIAEDSLFQISALRQSGGIDVDNMQQLVQNQKQLAQKAAQAALIKDDPQQGTKAGSSKRGGITVIPCSIRCPGMEGAVPNLQCIRCLCLFHAECLGLPPNLAFNKYLCSNCTEQQTTSSAAPAAATTQKNIMKKPSEVKRSPPGLAPIAHGNLRGPAPGRDITVTLSTKEGHTRLPQKVVPSSVGVARGMIRSRGMPPPHGRSPSTHIHHGQRMITDGSPSSMMGQHPQMIKRGRGRPPSVPQSRTLPQLSKNLTITHLPRAPGPPPVPNLQSMVTQKALPGKLPIPMMGASKPRQVMPAVPNLMKPNAFRLSVSPPSLSGRTFRKVASPSHHHTTNLRLSSSAAVANKSAGIVYTHAAPPNRTASLVKRYPQSVCTIGDKKFVVLPKRRPADFVPTTGVSTVGNGGLSKGITIDGIRQSDATIKKIVAIGDQITCTDGAKNNLVIDEPMDDGSTEAVSTDDTNPMDEVEEGGININTTTNESISANQ